MVTQENPRTYEFVGGNLALDFANTVHSVGAEDPQDDLQTWADLLAWGRGAGVVKKTDTDDGDLERFKDLRVVIFELFSHVPGKGKSALAAFNRHLKRSMAVVQLEHESGTYQLKSAHSDPASRLYFAITQAAADLLLSGQLDRVRQCAGENCTWLFLDTSRNGTRRWCEMSACGNRAKVRRFRKRQDG